ncbi:MAG TPA: hypothetical protein VES20_23290 [Bryobacteraceae bacterium]|nr:hypothetical protein [Bryobacteraceae bacterium]
MMRLFASSAFIVATLSLPLAAQTDRVPAGAEITVRTNEAIDAKHPSDSRIYTASVEQDVRDRNGNVVIPRGSDVELTMRDISDTDVIVDLNSVNVNGRRYMVDAQSHQVTGVEDERREGVGSNKRTGKYVGGGAVIGSIIGAIAGGGKGAAIGAATGAGAGAVTQTATRGGAVRLPSESLLTFRLDRPLTVGTGESSYMREGRRYRYDDENRYDRNNNSDEDRTRTRRRDRDRDFDRDRDLDRDRGRSRDRNDR